MSDWWQTALNGRQTTLGTLVGSLPEETRHLVAAVSLAGCHCWNIQSRSAFPRASTSFCRIRLEGPSLASGPIYGLRKAFSQFVQVSHPFWKQKYSKSHFRYGGWRERERQPHKWRFPPLSKKQKGTQPGGLPVSLLFGIYNFCFTAIFPSNKVACSLAFLERSWTIHSYLKKFIMGV